MSRLIDADALRAEFTTNLNELWHYTGIWAMIDIAPTVDAVEVVRCKDCIYHNSKSHNCGHPKMGFGLMNVNENDFCPHGERRTDE